MRPPPETVSTVSLGFLDLSGGKQAFLSSTFGEPAKTVETVPGISAILEPLVETRG